MPDVDDALRGLRCPTCHYDLTGLREHRCPECGGEFDPAILRHAGLQRTRRSTIVAACALAWACLTTAYQVILRMAIEFESALGSTFKDVLHRGIGLTVTLGVICGIVSLTVVATAADNKRGVVMAILSIVTLVISAMLAAESVFRLE